MRQRKLHRASVQSRSSIQHPTTLALCNIVLLFATNALVAGPLPTRTVTFAFYQYKHAETFLPNDQSLQSIQKLIKHGALTLLASKSFSLSGVQELEWQQKLTNGDQLLIQGTTTVVTSRGVVFNITVAHVRRLNSTTVQSDSDPYLGTLYPSQRQVFQTSGINADAKTPALPPTVVVVQLEPAKI
jgi:hypothetical protein